MVLKPAAFTALIIACVVAGLPHAVSLPIASSEFPKFQPAPIKAASCTLVRLRIAAVEAVRVALAALEL